MTEPTDAERILVLKAAGMVKVPNCLSWRIGKVCAYVDGLPAVADIPEMRPHVTLDLTLDENIHYLLPIAQKHINSAWPSGEGWSIMDRYDSSKLIVGTMEAPWVTRTTMGEALHAFVLALIKAGVIE